MGAGDGADGIGMDTDAVTEAGHRLQTTGDTLRDRWVPAAAAIIDGEAGIGHGRLADAFAPTYRTTSSRLRANADTFPPWITELATATSISASMYTTTDADVAARFRALTGHQAPGDDILLGPLPADG